MKNDILIQKYIEHNAYGRLLGMHFSILEPGICFYTCLVSSELAATPKAAHGGFVASLLDATMGVGALSLVSKEGNVVSTLEMKVTFLQSVEVNTTVFCTSRCIKQGNSILFMEAELKNEMNEILAISSGTFKKYQAEKAGY